MRIHQDIFEFEHILSDDLDIADVVLTIKGSFTAAVIAGAIWTWTHNWIAVKGGCVIKESFLDKEVQINIGHKADDVIMEMLKSV